MKTALLHIGTMKTGNTSIHHSLTEAKARGLLGTVSYPLWREDKHQARMAALYCPDTLGDVLPSLRGRFPQDPAQFRHMLGQYRRFMLRELRRARGGAILSAEPFCHLFTAEMAAALRRDLEAAGFEQFVVVLYVRDPADYYLSVINQNLRMSEPLPLVKDPATFRYGCLDMADAWEQAFPGALRVRRYPPQTGGDAIADFNAVVEDVFGLALPAVPVRQNASLSAEGMQILQDYRAAFSAGGGGQITRDAADLAKLLIRSADALVQTRPVLRPELACLIRHNHRADAQALHSRYGVDFGHDCGAASAPELHQDAWGVEDIVERVDPHIVAKLHLWIAHEELHGNRPQRSLPYRLAASIHRRLPQRWKSPRLKAALKRLL